MPTRLLPPLVEPGTSSARCIGDAPAPRSPARRSSRRPATTPGRRSPPCPPAAHRAFLSSGTWSLLGTELAAPVITPRARELNFTNEGGVVRHDAAAEEHRRPVAAAVVPARLGGAGARPRLRRAADAGAANDQPPFRSLFDPDHRAFLHPPDMVAAIARVLPRDRSARAADAGRVTPARSSRASRSSTASSSNRWSELTGIADHRDPHRRRRLAQPAAEPVHRRRHRPHRHRRPGRGDRARQHRDADGGDRRRGVAGRGARRSSSDRSRSSASSRSSADRWDSHYRAFPGLRGADLCLKPRATETTLSARTSGTSRKPRRSRRSPLELLRYRSNLLGADLRITNFGGGNTSSKFELPDPLTGQPRRVMAVKGSGGDLRSIGTSGFAILYLDKLEATRSRATAARRTRTRWSASTRSARSARTASPRRSTRRCTRSCRSRTSITCTRTGRSRWRRAPTARQKLEEFNRAVRPPDRVGAVAAARLRAGADAEARGRGHSRLRRHHPRRPRPVHVGQDAARVLRQQHPHDRSDGGVHRGAREARRPAAVRRRRGHGGVADRETVVAELLPVPARRGVVEPARHRALRRRRRTR